MKILMVCLGNICRSPLAEGILRHKVKNRQLDWEIDSAGIGGWHSGELPDRRAIQTARQQGIDITDQRARQIQPADLATFDLILPMDKSNWLALQNMAVTPQEKQKIKLIMDFVAASPSQEVPDPYYDGRFQHVFDLLDTACDKLIAYYQTEKSLRVA